MWIHVLLHAASVDSSFFFVFKTQSKNTCLTARKPG
jgi:uncharacterized membrane protein